MRNHGFTRRWVLVSIGGLFLGPIVQNVAEIAVGPILLPEKAVMALFPLDLSLGLTIGTLQALVLRRYLARAWVWALATGAGVAAAEIVAGFLLHDIMGFEFGIYRSPLLEALAALAIVSVTLGAFVGSAQWIVLYQAGYRSLLWIPLTIAGFTAAIAVTDYLCVPEAFIATFLGMLAGLVLGGVFYGLPTGLLLARLLSRQPPQVLT